MKKLLDDGSINGVRQWHDYNPLTDETTISYEQDVSAILEANKAAYNDGTNGYVSKSKEMKKVALIPHVVSMKWLAEEGINIWDKNHWPAVVRKLNDPEYLYLRTSGGKI